MVIQKGQQINLGKTFEPSRTAKSWTLSYLLQLITGKSKQAIKTEFTRKKIRLSNIEDVKNYIENRYKSKFL